MAKSVTYKCDKCGKTSTDVGFVKTYWAFISLKSHMYLFDNGTAEQNHDWHLCRECKVEFLDDMDKMTKKTKAKTT